MLCWPCSKLSILGSCVGGEKENVFFHVTILDFCYCVCSSLLLCATLACQVVCTALTCLVSNVCLAHCRAPPKPKHGPGSSPAR